MKAGVCGATIFHGRGTRARQSLGYLAMSIKPEKEIILVVTKEDQTEKIFNLIVREGQLDRPGKGFAFIQKVEKAVGPEDIKLEASRREMEKEGMVWQENPL